MYTRFAWALLLLALMYLYAASNLPRPTLANWAQQWGLSGSGGRSGGARALLEADPRCRAFVGALGWASAFEH